MSGDRLTFERFFDSRRELDRRLSERLRLKRVAGTRRGGQKRRVLADGRFQHYLLYRFNITRDLVATPLRYLL